MHVAILPASSPLRAAAAPLVAAGRLRLVTAPEELGDLGSGDQALLHIAEAGAWLSTLTNRCRAARLGAVHVLVEAEPPAWDVLGFRVRPWVQAIHFVGPDAAPFPAGAAPAPLVRTPTLEAVVAAATRPGFRRAELPTAFPPKIQIETTAHCGINCDHCPKSWQEPDRTLMGEDLFGRILAECGVGRPDSIELYLNGEPLTDRRLEALADIAKAASPHSLIEIITHERSINLKRAPRLAASGLDAVFVSVNVPAGSDPAEIRRRLERIAAIREVFVARGKHLGIVVLWNLLDAATRARMEALCRELGVPFERFRATTRMGDVDLDQYAHAERAVAVSRFCERPFTKAYIRATGDVLLCCEDWQDRWVLGNLHESSLAEIWASPAYRERRRSFLEGRPTAPCEGCEYIARGPAVGSAASAASAAE